MHTARVVEGEVVVKPAPVALQRPGAGHSGAAANLRRGTLLAPRRERRHENWCLTSSRGRGGR